MSNKLIAFRLQKEGKSYREISKMLSISKSTAFEYVKEMNLALEQNQQKRLQRVNEVEANIGTKERQQNPSNTSPPQNNNQQQVQATAITTPLPNTFSEAQLEQLELKEFTGDELIKKEFECLAFEGKFLELIGKPSRVFSGIIWGMPKGGKSNFALRFADYLQEYFGKVLYVAAEEGESVTLQEKFKDIDGSKLTVIETRDRDKIRTFLQQRQEFGFIFIDSINNANIDNDFLELLKSENKNRSFISIVQATKSGKFKGDQALTHNCDFIITVVNGIASHQGRFNVASEINIFEDGALYQKNPVKKTQEPKPEPKEEIIIEEPKEPESKPVSENNDSFDADRKKFLADTFKGLGTNENSKELPKPKSKALTKKPNPIWNNTPLPSLSSENIKKITIGITVGFIAVKLYEYFQDDTETNQPSKTSKSTKSLQVPSTSKSNKGV